MCLERPVIRSRALGRVDIHCNDGLLLMDRIEAKTIHYPLLEGPTDFINAHLNLSLISGRERRPVLCICHDKWNIVPEALQVKLMQVGGATESAAVTEMKLDIPRSSERDGEMQDPVTNPEKLKTHIMFYL